MQTPHENKPFFCKEVEKEVKFPNCRFLNASTCPHYRSCFIRVILNEKQEDREKTEDDKR